MSRNGESTTSTARQVSRQPTSYANVCLGSSRSRTSPDTVSAEDLAEVEVADEVELDRVDEMPEPDQAEVASAATAAEAMVEVVDTAVVEDSAVAAASAAMAEHPRSRLPLPAVLPGGRCFSQRDTSASRPNIYTRFAIPFASFSRYRLLTCV